MKKLLVIDDNSLAAKLIGEFLPEDIETLGSSAGIQAEKLINTEKPQLLLVNVCAKDVNKLLDKLEKKSSEQSLGLVLFGANAKDMEQMVKQRRPLDSILLPFEPGELESHLDEAFITAMGLRDEFTGLYKKPCFDEKIKKKLDNKIPGTLFYINLDRLSFASNVVGGAELQVCVYAIKTELEGTLMGINGDQIMGYLENTEKHSEVNQRMDKLIELLREGAATGAEAYVSIGAATSSSNRFNYEEMCLEADRALGVARSSGKNCCRFYRMEEK